MTNALSPDRRDFFGLALGGLALGLAAVSPRAVRAQATGAKLKIATIGAGREGGYRPVVTLITLCPLKTKKPICDTQDELNQLELQEADGAAWGAGDRQPRRLNKP